MIHLDKSRRKPASWRSWLAALRPAHWAKNGLLVVPALLGQVAITPDLVSNLCIGFVLASACASAGYLLNDALDRDPDRAHPLKRYRPVASGSLSIASALCLAAILAAGSLILAWLLVGLEVASLLLAYLALTALYSLAVKRWLAADVLLLAGLHMLRLQIGAVIAGVVASVWLIAFGFAFFLALGLLKRLDELATLGGREAMPTRRAYDGVDPGEVQMAALVAGLAAMGLLVSYVAVAAQAYYSVPAWLWLAVALIGIWLVQIMRQARLGRLNADPVAYAIADPLSLGLGLGVVLAILLGR